MASKSIEIVTEGGKFEAYLSTSDTGKGPGVVLLSSIFGLTQNMKDMSDDLASRGCIALVQNLFWRDQDSGALAPEDFQRAVARAQRLDFAKSMDDVERAVAEVKGHPNCNSTIALLG